MVKITSFSGQISLTRAIVSSVLLSVSASNAYACDAEAFRAFDFWLGEWQVTRAADGQTAGKNIISLDLNRCAVMEHYTTPTGYEGRSINAYNQQTGLWHQTWVDNGGLVLLLAGRAEDKAMRLSGAGKNQAGDTIEHEIHWQLREDGTVRQHWRSRQTDTSDWQTTFDGIYTKISSQH